MLCREARGVIDWTKILTDPRYLELYNKYLLDLTSTTTKYDDFNDSIIKAAENTSLLVKQKCEGWFQFNRDTLAPLGEERNNAVHGWWAQVS